MNIPSPYFEDIPGHGDLELDQIIVDYDYPLLSVLRDAGGQKFLCFCFEIRGAQQWLIAPIAREKLQQLLLGNLSLYEPFSQAGEVIHATYDYTTKQTSYEVRVAGRYPDLSYPADEPLAVDEGEWAEYIQKLNT